MAVLSLDGSIGNMPQGDCNKKVEEMQQKK